jgi:hypothetical protein
MCKAEFKENAAVSEASDTKPKKSSGRGAASDSKKAEIGPKRSTSSAADMPQLLNVLAKKGVAAWHIFILKLNGIFTQWCLRLLGRH